MFKKYEYIWNRFCIKSNKNKLQYPVNFLGSVEHHKKLFIEAINEIEKEFKNMPRQLMTYTCGPMEAVTLEEMTGWRNEVYNKLEKINIKVFDPVEQESKKVGKDAEISIEYMKKLKKNGEWKKFYKEMFKLWFGTISPNTDIVQLLQHLRMKKHIETDQDKYFENMGDAEAVVRSDFIVAYCPNVSMVGTIYEIMIAFLFRIPVYFIVPDREINELNTSLLFGGMISNNGKLKAYKTIDECIDAIKKDWIE